MLLRSALVGCVSCQLRIRPSRVCASSLHSHSLAASGRTRTQEEPGRAKGSQEEQEEEPRGASMSQGEPEGAGGSQEDQEKPGARGGGQEE